MAKIWGSLCYLCRQSSDGDALCQSCWRDGLSGAQGVGRLRCRFCARGVMGLIASDAQGDTPAVCGSCTNHPLPLYACVAAVDYGYPWRQLLHEWKIGGEIAHSRILAQLLYRAVPDALRAVLQDSDVLVPIPLSTGGLRQRGFHHTMGLAQAILRVQGIARPIAAEALQRVIAESALDHRDRDAAKRSRAMAAAMMPNPLWIGRLRGQRVLLIDDIVTTGATLTAAANVLHAAGVAGVSAVVVARA